VFIGTLAPLVNDALGLQGISVGPGWFRLTFPFLALLLVALVSVGIHAAWKRGHLATQKRRLFLGASTALVVGLPLVFGAYGAGDWRSILGVVLGCWVIISSLFDPIDRWRRKLTLSRAVIGMTLAHMAIGVCVIAISTVESYTIERDVAVAPGETLTLG